MSSKDFIDSSRLKKITNTVKISKKPINTDFLGFKTSILTQVSTINFDFKKVVNIFTKLVCTISLDFQTRKYGRVTA